MVKGRFTIPDSEIGLTELLNDALVVRRDFTRPRVDVDHQLGVNKAAKKASGRFGPLPMI